MVEGSYFIYEDSLLFINSGVIFDLIYSGLGSGALQRGGTKETFGGLQ